MSKVFQASGGLLKIINRCQRLTSVMSSSQRLDKFEQHGLGPIISSLNLPVRGLKNQAIQFRKAPVDYPPVTGSDHWRRKMRTLFRSLDVNGDGYITKEDYVISAKRCAEYLDLDDERAEYLLNQRVAVWESISKSSEDTSKISEEECLRSAIVLCNQRSYRQEVFPKQISMHFTAVDLDSDGLISREEHSASCYSSNIPEEEAQKLFDLLDPDKDGFITIDEFAQSFTEFFFTEDPHNTYSGMFGPLAD
ncbi:luciferin-binding protein-like [Lingula anatina]|uniref:Luciferin-binding protein-like n=1 Tax=Lingula anatina TaxID=7574 RepID=A0A1S3IWZ2_LINAN|nr:luciferin-binding protein-like [Lingula anatina]|eukprot:XP_013402563.1 luciferin-binding protein-like [Lingula anatina]